MSNRGQLFPVCGAHLSHKLHVRIKRFVSCMNVEESGRRFHRHGGSKGAEGLSLFDQGIDAIPP